MTAIPEDDVLTRFEAGELPRPFGHREHVAICWRFVRAYGAVGALDRLPAALRRAVAALGVPERYHETLTWAWILEVAERFDDSPDPDVFLARHPELATDLVRARYGDRLDAPDARGRFVLPNRWAGVIQRDHGPIHDAEPALRPLYDAEFPHGWQVMADRLAMACVLWTAVQGGEVVGFKLGYEREAGVFHSTLGAVAPATRGRGIGRALMRAQHAWARERGYARVTTSTMNRFPAMLHLDLSEGFEIVGTTSAPDGQVKIRLCKELR